MAKYMIKRCLAVIPVFLAVAFMILTGCVVERAQPATTVALPTPPAGDPADAGPATDVAPADEPAEIATADVPATEVLPDPESDEGFQRDPVTDSPLDDLAEADPEPTPEELERSRDLVADEGGMIAGPGNALGCLVG